MSAGVIFHKGGEGPGKKGISTTRSSLFIATRLSNMSIYFPSPAFRMCHYETHNLNKIGRASCRERV